MKKLLLGIVVGFILFSGVSSAGSISFYRREVEISPSEANVEDTLIFESSPEKMEIPLLFEIHDFSSRSTFEEHECVFEDKEYGSLITCETPEGENKRLTLEFRTQDLVRNVGVHYHFKDDLMMPLNTETLVYNGKLEEGLLLISDDKETPFPKISPGHGEEGSDGRRIHITWSDENISQGSGISPSISFERAEETTGMISEAYFLLLGVALILVMLVLGLKTGEKKDRIPDALKKDEMKVMKIVEEQGGEIKQKRIVDGVDFSKAKVSRIVQDLKERGLLETEKVGRTNRVKLKRK